MNDKNLIIESINGFKEAFEEEDIDELVKSTYEEIIDGME